MTPDPSNWPLPARPRTAPGARRALQPLFDGPLDVIGDVHGELRPLLALVAALGYDADGRHPRGRRMVFVGDLVDRGPDSPGVVAQVARWMADGRAQCVLGNHELNLLRGVPKDGNGWFFAADHDRARGHHAHARRCAAGARAPILAFLDGLPLALERADLRVVHAAWDRAALEDCAAADPACPWAAVYAEYAARALAAQPDALATAAAAEGAAHGARLRDPDAPPPPLEASARSDVHYQMSNPLRIVTSGVERLAPAPFYASGRWRRVERVRWWDEYAAGVPVLFGHYWRWWDEAARLEHSRGERDLFDGRPPQAWLGPAARAFCNDFAVGARHLERARAPAGPFRTRLAAVRWPERLLVCDDGERRELEA